MKCDEFIERMPEYWEEELTELQRFKLDQHRKSCISCQQEYLFWEESGKLISSSGKDFEQPAKPFTISQDVMSRIYSEQRWAEPVNRRPFILSDQFRGWVSIISAVMFILFAAGVLFSSLLAEDATIASSSADHQWIGVQPVGTATTMKTSQAQGELFYGVVASIGEPAILPPEENWVRKSFAISLSLLGLTFIVGFMSWISRAKTVR
jgi:hypothetical protein